MITAYTCDLEKDTATLASLVLAAARRHATNNQYTPGLELETLFIWDADDAGRPVSRFREALVEIAPPDFTQSYYKNVKGRATIDRNLQSAKAVYVIVEKSKVEVLGGPTAKSLVRLHHAYSALHTHYAYAQEVRDSLTQSIAA